MVCPWILGFPVGWKGQSPIITPHHHRSPIRRRPSSWGGLWSGEGFLWGQEGEEICLMKRLVGPFYWGGGHVLLCLLPCIIIFRVGGDNPLGPFRVVSDHETCIG